MDYTYQLTEWVEDVKELKGIIRQIEQYEGKNKGYQLKGGFINKSPVVAVFTTGELRELDYKNVGVDKEAFSYADVRSYKAD